MADEVMGSSKYAKAIFLLSGVILLGLIASDRQLKGLEGMRHELVLRRAHAQEMATRIALLKNGDSLSLINICYQAIAGTGPQCRIEKGPAGELSLFGPSTIPVGIIGNFNTQSDGAIPDNKWSLPPEVVLAKLNDLVSKVTPQIASASTVEIAASIRASIAILIDEALMDVWAKSFPDSPETDKAKSFVKLALLSAATAPRPGKSTEAAMADVAGTLKYFWQSKYRTTLDDEAVLMLIERTFGPSPISYPSFAIYDGDVESLSKVLMETRKGELIDEEVSWIVTGGVGFFDLDRESFDSPSLGLGYVEKLDAYSDLPVFSAYEFVGLTIDKVQSLVKVYQTEIEKMLMAKAVAETPIEIFGSSIKLRVSDLLYFAGLLVAILQTLYLISVAQEPAPQTAKHASRSAPFPRFSSPSDPFTQWPPRSVEELFERIVYAGFLAIPTGLVFLAWLCDYRFSNLANFFAIPSYFWDPNLNLATAIRRNRVDGFAAFLYASTMACSCYVMHRSALSRETNSAGVRWPRSGVVWRASLVTMAFGVFFAFHGAPLYFEGALLFLICGLLAYFWDGRGALRPWTRKLAVVLGIIVGVTSLIASFVASEWPSKWRPIYFLLPFGTNVLFPVMVLCCGLFAAVRRRMRVTFCFFLSAVLLIAATAYNAFRALLWAL